MAYCNNLLQIVLFNYIIFSNNYNSECFEDVSWKSWSGDPWTWGDFLEEQFYETLKSFEHLRDEVESIQPVRQKRSVDDHTRIDFQISSIFVDDFIKDVESPAIIFQISGQKFILVNDNVHRIHQHEDGKIYVEFSHLLDNVDYIYAVETIDYENFVYVLLQYKNYAEVLKIPNHGNQINTTSDIRNDIDSIDFSRKFVRQRISSEGNDISKARIFVYNGSLFAFILYTEHGAKVNSGLYKWSGSHLDEIHQIQTEAPTDSVILSLKESVGIIIIQNSTKRISNGTWEMYIMDDKGLKRMYNQPTQKGVIMALAYNTHHHNNRFDKKSYNSLFVSSAGLSRIYKISEDGKITETDYAFDFKNITTVIVSNLNEREFIFLASKNEVFVYTPDSDNLQHLVKIKIAEDQHILAMDTMILNDGGHGLNVLSKDHKNMYYILIKFHITEDVIVSVQEPDNLQKCFADVEYLLNEKQLEIDELKMEIDGLKDVDEILHIPNEVDIFDSQIDNIQLSTTLDLKVTTKEIMELARSTQEQLDQLEELATYLLVEDEPVMIKNDIKISGDLTIDNFYAPHVQMLSINSYPFSADSFYTEDDGQEFPGELLYGKRIIARKLFAPVFNEQIGQAPILSSLSANNIFIAQGQTINDIDPASIVTPGYQRVITGTKSFQSVRSQDVFTERLGQETLNPWLAEAINKQTPTKHLKVDDDVIAKDIIVKKINGIDFNEFLDSIVLKGSKINVKGDLHFLTNLSVNNLKTETLQSKLVHKFLTKTTEQKIASKMSIRNILVTSLDANRINGVDFARNVAVIGKHNAIKSPTTIFNLDVLKDLILNCGSEDESFCNIIATKPEDLLQIYNGPVTIQGSLLIQDLKFGSETNVKVNEEIFNTEVESLYWMKSKNQIIPTDVIFDEILTVPQLLTKVINNRDVSDLYAFGDKKDMALVFKNVTVRRDVMTGAEGDGSLVKTLNDTVVKKNERYHIKGKKTFANKLITKALQTKFVNQRNVMDIMANKLDGVKFTGDVYLENARVLGTLQVYTDVGVQVVNGFKWFDFVKQSAMVNQPTYLESAVFHGLLDARSVKVEQSPLLNIADTPDILEVDVTVHGPASIRAIFGNEHVNNINMEEYSRKVVRKNEPAIITGVKTFVEEVRVSDEFESYVIDGVPFKKLMLEALTKSDNQFVYGTFTVGDIKSDYLVADSINNIPAGEFISTAEPEIVINTGLVLENEQTVQNNFNSKNMLTCDLNMAVSRLYNVPKRHWNEVTVEGDVYWMNMDEKIWRILEKSVTRNRNTFVDAEVILDGKTTTYELHTKPTEVDNQLQALVGDSVKKFSETPQIITGTKIFKNNLQASYASIDHLYTTNVNNRKNNNVSVLNTNQARQ